MRTSKAISTISYNSQEFLVNKLNELIEAHTISDYYFINHFPEQDEKKAHIHLFIQPNKLIDTMYLQDYFKEVDINNLNAKPLKCIDFRLSKLDDWFLYCLHYEPYLSTKCESREFHYTKDDFVYYDEDNFDYNYNHALKGSDFAHNNQILNVMFDSNINPIELLKIGAVPINLASQLNAINFMRGHYGTLERGNHKNHEVYEDEVEIESLEELKQLTVDNSKK